MDNPVLIMYVARLERDRAALLEALERIMPHIHPDLRAIGRAAICADQCTQEMFCDVLPGQHDSDCPVNPEGRAAKGESNA